MHEIIRPADAAKLLGTMTLVMLKYRLQQHSNWPIHCFDFLLTKRGLCFCALILTALKAIHHYQKKTRQNLFSEPGVHQRHEAAHQTNQPSTVG